MIFVAFRNWRRLLSAFCALTTLFVLGSVSTLTGCRPGVPAAGPRSRIAQPNGTITGTVRAPEGRPAVEGRVVEAIDVDTGERRRATTNSTGGFTFDLKPGMYRIQLTLRPGESLARQPRIIDLNQSDVDADADFVIGGPRGAAPADPAKYSGSSLGPPIA
jgi:hypothetical protein